MNFNLTDEQSMLSDMLRRFFNEAYTHEKRRQLIADGHAFDKDIYTQIADLGVLGALFDEENGGLGGSGADIMVVFEEIGRAGAIDPILSSAILAGGLIAALGTDTQHELLSDIISGQRVVAFAHTEPNSRYDPAHVETQVEHSDSGFTLTGRKDHVFGGAEADDILIAARSSGAYNDETGISLFLVPRETPGLSVTQHRTIDGFSMARVTFDNMKVDAAARLGDAGKAFPAIEAVLARATLAICAEAVGAMESAKDLTVDYARERKQFGKPIGSFQALQHRMADLLIEIEQARSSVINLAGNLTAPRNIRERYVSATKNLVGRAGALLSEECIQIHGGIGMTDEYALSHFSKRLVMIDHLFGDVDHHLERFTKLSAA